MFVVLILSRCIRATGMFICVVLKYGTEVDNNYYIKYKSE